MSLYQFFASHKPLKEMANPYIEHWSINDLIAKNMEVPFHLLDASIDRDEKICIWFDSEEHMGEINIFNAPGSSFPNYKEVSDKSKIANLEWRYTDKRAEALIQYLSEVLNDANYDDEIEFWHVWMDDSLDALDLREYEVDQLTVPILRELLGKECYEHPICLRIRK